MSHLGKYLREMRLSKGLKVLQVAKAMGIWTNLNNGCSAIHSAEKSGYVWLDLLNKLVAFYNCDKAVVQRLIDQDRQERVEKWNRWADEPIVPYFVIRMMSAVYSAKSLPVTIKTLEEAEAFASARAKEIHKRCCLVWSRRLTIFYGVNGQVEERKVASLWEDNQPSMKIGGSPVDFRIS